MACFLWGCYIREMRRRSWRSFLESIPVRGLRTWNLRAGNLVEILDNNGKGPILIRVDESSITLVRCLAMNITVRRIVRRIRHAEGQRKRKITRTGSLGPFKRRFMDMGVLVGEETWIKIVAPLDDPIEVQIKN